MLQQSSRQRDFIPFDEAQSFLLAYSTGQPESEQKAVKHLAERLRQRGKTVMVLSYYPKRRQKKGEIPPDDTRSISFTRNDFDLLGLPKSEKVKKFLTQVYDYFIGLSMDNVLPLKAMAGMTRSRCRIGFYREQFMPYYDLMFGQGGDGDMNKFIADIEHYLKLLKR